MNFLNDYFNNIVKYDLINKFQYKKINIIPKIKTVILKFKCKTNDFKELITVFSFLEFITTRNGMITISKKPNIVLKIKKNVPIGCKVFLKKKLIFLFFLNTICKKFLETKNSKKFKNKKNFSFISFKLKNNLTFLELQTNYFLFNKLPPLDITLITNKITYKEFKFLFNSFKIFIFAKITQWQSIILPRLKLRVQISFFAIIKNLTSFNFLDK